MDDETGDNGAEASPLQPDGNRKRPGPTIELKANDVPDTDNAKKEGAREKKSRRWRERLKGFSMPSFAMPSFRFPSFGVGLRRAVPLIVPVVTSAAVAALVTAGILLAVRPAMPTDPSVPSATDSALIDALRVRIAALEARGTPSAQTAAADPAVTTKISAIEKSLASLRDDIGKLRAQNETAAASIDALKSASQDSANAAADTSAIEERLAKLERATVALTADVPSRTPAVPADPTVPRAAAAALLDQAVRQSEPFESALSGAKKFGDTGALKALELFAATGVPTANALSQELLALLPQTQPKTDDMPASAGIWQRLQQSALRLVRVRRIDDAQTQDLLARVRDAAQNDDVAEARRILMTLPDADRAPMQPWIDKVDAREAALAAARRYAQDAMSVVPRSADPR